MKSFTWKACVVVEWPSCGESPVGKGWGRQGQTVVGWSCPVQSEEGMGTEGRRGKQKGVAKQKRMG